MNNNNDNDLEPWKDSHIVYHSFTKPYLQKIDNFTVTLKEHQKIALGWMMWREIDPPGGLDMRGGIVAD